jgi:serine/threonine protein kinase
MAVVDAARPADLDAPPLALGGTFERYEIVRLIGRGGTAWVYEGYQSFMDRRVAIKVIPCDAGQAQEYKRRAKAEAIVLSRLRHPNVVAVLDAGVTEDGGLIYIVMELLEGRTMREVLNALHVLSVPEALILGAQICDAVEAAHRHGAIHRDLKPDNIFIEHGNHARVLDFGVAKFLGAGFVTAKFRWHGTPLYMSPEHLQGKGVTERSDVYALGTLLYEALAGTNPCLNGIDTPSFQEIGWIQITHVPPALTEVVPAIPDYVARAIQRAIAKAPEHRYGSMHEFGIALRDAERRFTLECRQRRLAPTLRDLVGEADAVLGARKRPGIPTDKARSAPGPAVSSVDTEPMAPRSFASAEGEPHRASERTPLMSDEPRLQVVASPGAAPEGERKALDNKQTVRMFQVVRPPAEEIAHHEPERRPPPPIVEPTPSPIATPMAKIAAVEEKAAPAKAQDQKSSRPRRKQARGLAGVLTSPRRAAVVAAVCGLVVAIPIGLAVGLSRRAKPPETRPAAEVSTELPTTPLPVSAPAPTARPAATPVPTVTPAETALKNAAPEPAAPALAAQKAPERTKSGPQPTATAKPASRPVSQPPSASKPPPASSKPAAPDHDPLPPLPGSGI